MLSLYSANLGPRGMLIVRGLIASLLQVVFLSALLLIPAGTWHWPRAFQFLAAYSLLLIGFVVLAARVAPASLETRLRPPAAKSQPMGDRLATAFLYGSISGWAVLIPLDVHRLHLLPPPPSALAPLAVIAGLGGFAIIAAAVLENAFASPIVEDQTDRGHELVDTGLYAQVRHPLYLGLLVLLAGMGLWLESVAAVLALTVVMAALAIRVTIEERTLRSTLAGYPEYTERVRYRIIPWIW